MATVAKCWLLTGSGVVDCVLALAAEGARGHLVHHHVREDEVALVVHGLVVVVRHGTVQQRVRLDERQHRVCGRNGAG